LTRLRRLLAAERGYSLVELLTVMALLSTVLGGMTTLFVSGSNSELDLNRRFQAQQTARVALDRIRRDIHCSSAAVAPTATPPASSTTLVLVDPCVTNGYIAWCTVAHGSSYDLYRKLATTCDNTGTKYATDLVNASGLIFTYTQQSTASLSTVHVDLQVNLKPTVARGTYKLVDDITLRNSARTCLAAGPSNFASPSPPC
jgi:prepilin-type N-terminal cleavage/methylation domain-containing protein